MSIKFRLNGDSDLVYLENYQVANLILERVPSQSFTSVEVEEVMYTFPTQEGPVKARKITLLRSSLSVAWESIKAFFMELFSPSSAKERYRDDPKAINGALIRHFLGRDANMSPEDMEKASEELVIAYNRSMEIRFHISNDCNWIAGEPLKENMSVVQARNCNIF